MQEDQEFKVNLSYKSHLRSTWDMRRYHNKKKTGGRKAESYRVSSRQGTLKFSGPVLRGHVSTEGK